MPVSDKYLAKLVPDHFFHVYNRTNNKELLFLDDEDRSRFLLSYFYYLSPMVDTFAYCLLPNHFHFLIKVKSLGEILRFLRSRKNPKPTKIQKKFLQGTSSEYPAHLIVQSQFHRFFTSYSMFIYNKWDREGNLFHRPFKRLPVQSERYLANLIFYIHFNPLKHGIIGDFTSYPWSSFQSLTKPQENGLMRRELLEWFGGEQAFQAFHLRDELPEWDIAPEDLESS